MSHLQELKTNKEIFLKFMHGKYPLVEKSNIFLRDLQYAIHNYFGLKSIQLSYTEAENLALALATEMESMGELLKLNKNTWKVNFSTDYSVSISDDTE